MVGETQVGLPTDGTLIENLLWDGWKWTDSGGSVDLLYFFSSDSGISWADNEKEGYALAAFTWERVANITLTATAIRSSANLVENLLTDAQMIGQTGSPPAAGFHDTPDVAGAAHVVTLDGTHSVNLLTNQEGGFYDAQSSSWTADALLAGGFYERAIIHEIGHALGLKHPHNAIGSAPLFPGVSEGGTELGDNNLNHGLFSIMSYNREYSFDGDGHVVLQTGAGLTIGGNPVDNYGYATGPMAFDIAAIQYLYGAKAANTGDSTYFLPDVDQIGTFWLCIWDTGGEDTLEYDGSKNAILDLTAATLDNSPTGGGVLSYAAFVHGGFTIANGVVIEDAVGGSGNDTITGNSADNYLVGNGGSDVIVGGAGNDTINGGAGIDFLTGGTTAGGSGADTFVFDNTSSIDLVTDYDYNSGDKVDVSFLVPFGQLAANVVRVLADIGGSYATLQVDTDGSGSSASWVTIASLTGVMAGHLVKAIIDSGTPAGVTLDVTHAAPEITSYGGGDTFETTISENTTGFSNVVVTNPTGGSMSFSLTGEDASKFNLTAINSTTASFTFVNPPDYENPDDTGANHDYHVVLTATDDEGVSDSQSITIHVTNVDESPSGADKTVSTPADGSYTFQLEDFGFAGVAGKTFTGVYLTTVPTHGTLTLDGVALNAHDLIPTGQIAGNQLVYTPGVGASGNNYASFTFQVEDSGFLDEYMDPTPNTITVNVTAGNQPPTLDLDLSGGGTGFDTTFVKGGSAIKIVDSDMSVTDDSGQISSARIVLFNAHDGDSLSVVTAGLPIGISPSVDTSVAGRITLTLTGDVAASNYEAWLKAVRFNNTSATPNTESRLLAITVNDGTFSSNTATATVHISSTNSVPVAANGSKSLNEDATASGSVFASDGDDQTLTYALVSGVNHGTLTLSASGSYSYRPTANYHGTDSFTFKASDGLDDSNTATFTFNVASVNDTPALTADTKSVNEYATATGNILTNDHDADTDKLTISKVNGFALPSAGFTKATQYGVLTIHTNGSYSYVAERQGGPLDLQVGAKIKDTISYVVSDGHGGTATSSLTFTITGSATGNNSDNHVIGTAAANTLKGNGGNDTLMGRNGADILAGGSGDDHLLGGLGKDKLTGSSGKDHFVFDTTPSASNVDTIVDFIVKDDTIDLENAVFKKLTGAANKPLSSSQFWIGSAAHDSNDHIIYNRATGALYYDPDGNKSHGLAEIKIATLSHNLHMTSADFLII